MADRFADPIRSAIRARRDDPCPPLQVANGTTAMRRPDGDPVEAARLKAAWLPTIPGQAVPMIGERRWDGDESCQCE